MWSRFVPELGLCFEKRWLRRRLDVWFETNSLTHRTKLQLNANSVLTLMHNRNDNHHKQTEDKLQNILQSKHNSYIFNAGMNYFYKLSH